MAFLSLCPVNTKEKTIGKPLPELDEIEEDVLGYSGLEDGNVIPVGESLYVYNIDTGDVMTLCNLFNEGVLSASIKCITCDTDDNIIYVTDERMCSESGKVYVGAFERKEVSQDARPVLKVAQENVRTALGTAIMMHNRTSKDYRMLR